MIVPDVNLLVYAYSASAPQHRIARRWWEDLLSSELPVGLPWAVACGFVRLMTHPAAQTHPMQPSTAIAHLRSWVEVSSVQVVDPGPRHLQILAALLSEVGVGGNLTTDAHIAAIAIEYQAEVHSSDQDFGRFPGLRWRNPLQNAQ